MGITFTESAIGELRRIKDETQAADGEYVRVGVVGGGCSGFTYAFHFTNDVDNSKDIISEQDGVKFAVDKKSDLFLDGTTVDFYQGLERRGFGFNNPNAVKSCGCGSSFSA